MKLLKLIALPLLLGSTSALAAGTYSVNGEGVTVMPDHGPAKVVKVGIYGDNIFRVTALPDTAATAPDSLMVGLPPGRLATPMSRQNTPLRRPVPSALEQASLAAKRLA